MITVHQQSKQITKIDTETKEKCPDCGNPEYVILAHKNTLKCKKCGSQFHIIDGKVVEEKRIKFIPAKQ